MRSFNDLGVCDSANLLIYCNSAVNLATGQRAEWDGTSEALVMRITRPWSDRAANLEERN